MPYNDPPFEIEAMRPASAESVRLDSPTKPASGRNPKRFGLPSTAENPNHKRDLKPPPGPHSDNAPGGMDFLSAARELAAIARTGLHFAKDSFDVERYRRVEEIAAALLASRSDVEAGDLLAWAAGDFGYATPKVDVRAFITDGDRVFLVREDSDGGRWTLPGGWADVNETPSRAVARETLEESGLEVCPLRLLAVLDREKQGHRPRFPYSVYKMVFHCEVVGGAPHRTDECSESGYFPVHALPELSTGRVLPEQIALFHDAVRHGLTETLFD